MGSKFALSRWLRHAGLLLGCLPSVASAQSIINWNNASGGSFHTASNWTPAGPPGPTNLAEFDLDATYTVNMTSSVTNAGLGVERGTVNLNLSSGTTYDLRNLFAGSSIGYSNGTASLNVSGGTTRFDSVVLGFVGSTGSLSYTGPAASFSTERGFTVGSNGTGNLDLQSGATGFIEGSCVLGSVGVASGKVQVLGTGSSLVCTGTLYVGRGNLGSVLVDGPGLGGDNGTISIGTGTIVGGRTGSAGLVRIFSQNPSTMGSTILGEESGSNGTLRVGDIASGERGSVILSGITVGQSGNGFMHIAPESVVVNTGSVTLAQNAGSNATVDVYGTWNNTGAITFGAGTGTINLNGGTLFLQALNLNGGTFNFNEGTVRFNSDWTGNFTQVPNLLGSSRSLSEGRTLEVGGTATLQSLLRLQGGTFRAQSIVGASNLSWSTGLVDITGNEVTIGSGGQWPVLNLGSGMTLRISGSEGNLTVADTGVLNLNGGTATGFIIGNYGEINLASASSTLGQAGNNLSNSGRIVGTGRVNASLGNYANGRIIVDAGHRLVFHGETNNNFAGGTLELSGGTVEFTNTLTNRAGGFISGRGVFRGSSGNTSGTGLVNLGAVAFSGGFSDVYGKVDNDATGQIISAGAGVLTFHDDVVHNGTEIRTTAGSRTVFLGGVSGAGAYTGTGTVEYQGDLRPGNSPANVFYSGSVVIGASATSHFEIGGAVPGSEYDRLTIAGAVALDGRLDINLINGFTPIAGQQFTLIDNLGTNPMQGTFSGIGEGSSFLSGGQLWSASYAGGDGNNFVLTAVPEPTTWALILGTGATLAGGCWWRKRRREQLLDGRCGV